MTADLGARLRDAMGLDEDGNPPTMARIRELEGELRTATVERDKLRMAIRNAIDNIGHGRHGHAIRQLRAARSLFE
jgi:hypothetical protein